MWETPSGIDGQRNDSDAIGAIVRCALELFPEHIRVDLFVREWELALLDERPHSFEKTIVAVDHGRAGVEEKATAGIKPIEALFHYAQRQLDPQFAATVPVEPRSFI